MPQKEIMASEVQNTP
jgi:hypothetical protein